jgi:hypothetical protein
MSSPDDLQSELATDRSRIVAEKKATPADGEQALLSTIDITKWARAQHSLFDRLRRIGIHKVALIGGTPLFVLAGAVSIFARVSDGVPIAWSDFVIPLLVGYPLAYFIIAFSFSLAFPIALAKRFLSGGTNYLSFPRRAARITAVVPFFGIAAREMLTRLSSLQRSMDRSGRATRRRTGYRFARVFGAGSILVGLVLLLQGEESIATRFTPLPQALGDWLSAGMVLGGAALLIASKWRGAPAIDARRAKVDRLLAVVLLVLAVCAFVSPLFYKDYYDAADTPAWFGWIVLLSFLLFGIAWRRFRRGNSFALPHAEGLLERDERAPVLYLRSFSDDGMSVGHATSDMFDNIGFEQTLSRYFSGFGPVVAIAEPRGVPQPGAARVFVPEESWQQRILAWMEQATLIVVVVGHTNAAKWELREMIARGYQKKCVFIIPPAKSRRPRLEGAEECFSGTQWESAIAHLGASRNLRTFHCRAGGAVTAFTSEDGLAVDYVIASAFTVYGLLCREA